MKKDNKSTSSYMLNIFRVSFNICSILSIFALQYRRKNSIYKTCYYLSINKSLNIYEKYYYKLLLAHISQPIYGRNTNINNNLYENYSIRIMTYLKFQTNLQLYYSYITQQRLYHCLTIFLNSVSLTHYDITIHKYTRNERGILLRHFL